MCLVVALAGKVWFVIWLECAGSCLFCKFG